MLENENIICFSSADWDNPLWTNKQHIMSRLSKNNKVFYIESLALRKPVVGKRDFKRILTRIAKWFKGIKQVNKNLYIFSPVIIPFHGSIFIRKINKIILNLFLKYYLKKYNFKNPVLWTYIPNIVDLLRKFGEKYIVYHCVDEISQFPGVTDKIINMEKELLTKADIVFVTSNNLFNNKRVYNKNTFYLPNVADVDHFSSSLRNGIEMPNDMKNIKKPILGFIGAIDDYKIDSQLLRYLADFNWSVVLIGPIGLTDKAKNLNKIIALKNIYYLGIKDYKILPNYIKYFDVCLIPFKVNKYTRNVFPMKFFEYLAAGKPVISVDLPSLENYTQFVYLAKDKYEFKKMIDCALMGDSENKIQERLKIAKENTWEKRIESMGSLIEHNISIGKQNENSHSS